MRCFFFALTWRSPDSVGPARGLRVPRSGAAPPSLALPWALIIDLTDSSAFALPPSFLPLPLLNAAPSSRLGVSTRRSSRSEALFRSAPPFFKLAPAPFSAASVAASRSVRRRSLRCWALPRNPDSVRCSIAARRAPLTSFSALSTADSRTCNSAGTASGALAAFTSSERTVWPTVCSTARKRSTSYCETRVIAIPLRPARAVRPTRCT
mmetsp:Transcript_35113/g.87568  ORF Transcript_35113/g.87568 Transcript_35113/m.87568 type:complete len:209 (-) Transcript_35113:1147-1773(-)